MTTQMSFAYTWTRAPPSIVSTTTNAMQAFFVLTDSLFQSLRKSVCDKTYYVCTTHLVIESSNNRLCCLCVRALVSEAKYQPSECVVERNHFSFIFWWRSTIDTFISRWISANRKHTFLGACHFGIFAKKNPVTKYCEIKRGNKQNNLFSSLKS